MDPTLFKPLLAADEQGRYYLVVLPAINDAFCCRIVHASEEDAAGEMVLSGLSAGAGPWVMGAFEFFGDADADWVRECVEYAAHIVERWHAQGRLTHP